MNERTTKGRVIGGGYSPRDAAMLRRAARRCLAWWKATTGSGVKLTKSDARFVLDAQPPPFVADVVIEGFWGAMVDANVGTQIVLGNFTAGDYRAWYDGGAFKFTTGYYGANIWASAIGSNGLKYDNAGANYYFPITTLSTPLEAEQSLAAYISGADVLGTNVITNSSDSDIVASFIDTNYADNAWASREAAYAFNYSPPRYGIFRNNVAKIFLPDTEQATYAALGTPGTKWRSYPYWINGADAGAPELYLYGDAAYRYRVRVDVTAYLPSKMSSGQAISETTYVAEPITATPVITPQWTGTPGQMATQTATVYVWVDGAGVDTPAGFVATNIHHAPNFANHLQAYLELELTAVSRQLK